MCVAWVLSGILGLVLGIVAGYFKDRLPDRLIRGYAPVSYTHLDVYKRQLRRDPDPCRKAAAAHVGTCKIAADSI